MKVIPVIDVLNGVAVHAIRGKRKEYHPLKSVLTASIDPLEVAKTFKGQGFSEVYLADLDAILGKKPDLFLYNRIVQTGLKLMVDAGVTDAQTAVSLKTCGVSRVIIGTETLQTLNTVKQAVQQIGAGRVIVSLDMKNNQIIMPPDFDGPKDALELLEAFRKAGVQNFLLLDLARVGSGEGANTTLLEEVLKVSGGAVYIGGGVRSIADLLNLKDLGVSGALLATALHTGKVAADDLKRAGLL